MICTEEENIIDKNEEVEATTSDYGTVRTIKVERVGSIEQDIKIEPTSDEVFVSTSHKLVPAYEIKIEKDFIQESVCDLESGHNTGSKSSLSNVIPTPVIKLENVNNIDTCGSEEAGCNIHEPSQHSSRYGIKQETVDVTYERTPHPKYDNNHKTASLPKEGIKVENVAVFSNNTLSTGHRNREPAFEFVPLQNIKVEQNDATRQGTEDGKTNYYTVPVPCLAKDAKDLNNVHKKQEYDAAGEVSSMRFNLSPAIAWNLKRSRGKQVIKIPKISPETVKEHKDLGGVLINNKVTCKQCPYQTNNEKHYSQHLKAHAAALSYKCSSCNYITVNKHHLAFHYNVHSSEKSYSCDSCDKQFNSKSDLSRHLRTHSGEKPFVCDICAKTFTDGTALRNHLWWHSGKKPYSCDVCKKTFTQRGNLTSHLKTHSRNKPYTCPVCNKSYGYKISLTNHVRLHTGEVLHSCNVCHKAFNSKGTLKTHFLLHTGERLYSCNVCKKSFILQTLLTRHMKKAHCDKEPLLFSARSECELETG